MNDIDRGKIINPSYSNQVIDYSDMKLGKITPTNIDGYMDIRGKGHWFYEAKYGDSKPRRGQALAFERLADATAPFSVYIIGSHDCPSTASIMASETKVTDVRFLKKWIQPSENITTRELTERFLNYLKDENYTSFYNYIVKPKQVKKEESTITLSSLEWLRLCP